MTTRVECLSISRIGSRLGFPLYEAKCKQYTAGPTLKQSDFVKAAIRKKLKSTGIVFKGFVSQKQITPRGKYPKLLIYKFTSRKV